MSRNCGSVAIANNPVFRFFREKDDRWGVEIENAGRVGHAYGKSMEDAARVAASVALSMDKAAAATALVEAWMGRNAKTRLRIPAKAFDDLVSTIISCTEAVRP